MAGSTRDEKKGGIGTILFNGRLGVALGSEIIVLCDLDYVIPELLRRSLQKVQESRETWAIHPLSGVRSPRN